MSDPSAGAGSCFMSDRRNAVIVTLLILLGVTTTGWVMTATRERQVAAVAPSLQTEQPVPPVEQVEVVVAAKDLPVGTVLNRDDLKKFVKTKKMPKDGLPPAYVTKEEDLVEKRLTRAMRAEETFNSKDLAKGGVLTLPDGFDLMTIPMNAAGAVAGFVGPGTTVDVLATLNVDGRLIAFPLLKNTLVIAVDSVYAPSATENTFPNMSSVTVALKRKESLALMLAKKRGAVLDLILRNPTKIAAEDKDYDIDKVVKILTDGLLELAPPPRPVVKGR